MWHNTELIRNYMMIGMRNEEVFKFILFTCMASGKSASSKWNEWFKNRAG